VKLIHRSGHACVLNSLALEMVGISGETPEPPGGLIDRDLESGEPSGLLFGMDSYIEKAVPPLGDEELRRGLRLAVERCLSSGITSVQDATVGNDLARWRTFERLKRGGELPIRIYMMVGAGALGEFEESGLYFSYGDYGLRLGAVKIVLDETTGRLEPSQAELNEIVLRAQRAGFQVAIHAIEEGAVASATEALEHACGESPAGTHRHRVEHCSVCPPPLLRRLRDVHAIIVTQPSFIYWSGERYLATVPEAQLRWLYCIGSFLRNGLRPAAGSDSPVVPINPLIGICAAVARKAETGETLSQWESISPLEALEMYTRAAAYASFEEAKKGSISVGKLADLVVLDADPTQVPAELIKDIRVKMTIIAGRVVWEA